MQTFSKFFIMQSLGRSNLNETVKKKRGVFFTASALSFASVSCEQFCCLQPKKFPEIFFTTSDFLRSFRGVFSSGIVIHIFSIFTSSDLFVSYHVFSNPTRHPTLFQKSVISIGFMAINGLLS